MGRAAIEACLPWFALLVVCFAVAGVLVRLNGSRLELGRLRRLHRDESGAVESLSFVLTLPIFLMIVMLIVQVSQLVIGTIVVHYAAFAAARTAIVWIPARLGLEESENCISVYAFDFGADDQVLPMLDPDGPFYGPGQGGVTYIVAPGSPKYEKIRSAAILACMPVCPSRNLGMVPSGDRTAMAEAIKTVYGSIAPQTQGDPRVALRLDNKLAYAEAATEIEVRFFHSNHEPPLVPYAILDDNYGDSLVDYMPGELGWQDPVTVTVRHEMALLPGPGRLLTLGRRPGGLPDRIAAKIGRRADIYVYPLEASVTMDIEGKKSVIPYDYAAY